MAEEFANIGQGGKVTQAGTGTVIAQTGQGSAPAQPAGPTNPNYNPQNDPAVVNPALYAQIKAIQALPTPSQRYTPEMVAFVSRYNIPTQWQGSDVGPSGTTSQKAAQGDKAAQAAMLQAGVDYTDSARVSSDPRGGFTPDAFRNAGLGAYVNPGMEIAGGSVRNEVSNVQYGGPGQDIPNSELSQYVRGNEAVNLPTSLRITQEMAAQHAQDIVNQRPGFTLNPATGAQQWGENFVELSSTYHDIANKAGIPMPANPYAYQGDLALGYLKGIVPGSASGVLGETPTDFSVLNLPKGKGIQDYAWDQAMIGKGGNMPAIPPGYEDAIKAIKAAQGQYGPYGSLYGGPDYKGTPSSQGIRLSPGYQAIPNAPTAPANIQDMINNSQLGKGSPEYYTDIGAKPFISTTVSPLTYRPTDTDLWISGSPLGSSGLAGPLVMASDFIFGGGLTVRTITSRSSELIQNHAINPMGAGPDIGSPFLNEYNGMAAPILANVQRSTVEHGLPEQSGWAQLEQNFAKVTTEKYLPPAIATPEMAGMAAKGAAFINPVLAPIVFDPIYGDQAAKAIGEFSLGAYQGIREKPVTASAITLASLGVGLFVEGVGGPVYGAARAATAENIIGGETLLKVPYRTYETIADLAVRSAPTALGGLYAADIWLRTGGDPGKLGYITSTEAGPMFAGFAGAGETIRDIRLSDIGYKAALQEGTTTSRLDYYVTEPAMRPVRMVQNDYAAFLQENQPVLTPQQKIDAKVLEIQRGEAFIPGTFERGYIFDSATGELLSKPIYGDIKDGQNFVPGDSIRDVFKDLQEKYPDIEEYTFMHTHPPLLRTELIPRVPAKLSEGWDQMLEGELSPDKFISGTARVIKYNTFPPSSAFPSENDIMFTRGVRGIFGVTTEGVIGETELTVWRAGMEGGQSIPRKNYEALIQSMQMEPYQLRQETFLRVGTELGFEPTLRTSAQLEAGIPKEPGLLDYLDYKAERITGSAEITLKSMVQEAPGRVSDFGMKAYQTYFNAKLDLPIAAENTLNRAYGLRYDLPSAMYETYFNARLEAPVAVTRASVGMWSTLSNVDIRLGQMPDLAVKSYLQEKFTPDRLLYLSSQNWMEGGVPVLSQGLPPAGWGENVLGGFGKVPPAYQGGQETSRVSGTKIVGGRTISALAKEPSLKSMGLTPAESSVLQETRLSIGQSIDYRGKPASATMKPMEMAGGQLILTEELPKVEGFTETPRAEQRQYYGAPSLRLGGVSGLLQVPEVSLQFGQMSEQRQRQATTPEQLMVSPALAVGSGLKYRSGLDIGRDVFNTRITDQAQATRYTFDTGSMFKSVTGQQQEKVIKPYIWKDTPPIPIQQPHPWKDTPPIPLPPFSPGAGQGGAELRGKKGYQWKDVFKIGLNKIPGAEKPLFKSMPKVKAKKFRGF